MKQACNGLYFREWKMMRGFFIGQFVVLIIFLFIPFGANIADKFVQLFVIPPIIVPAAMMFSLNTEVNQMELFLHNPQSIHKLIFVKLVNGLIFAISFIVVLLISAIIVDLIKPVFTPNMLDVLLYWSGFTVRLMISSIPFMAMLLFLWTLHQMFRNYLGTFFSLVIVIAVLIAGTQLINVVSQFDFYQSLSGWGAIEIPFRESPNLFVNKNIIYVGNMIFYGILSLVLYFISTYLIDHKLEV